MATVKQAFRVEGVRETQAAFRRLPKAARDALKHRTQELSGDLAASAATAARGHSRQYAMLAGLIRAYRGTTPAVGGGGARRVGRNRVPAYKVLFGAEFGSNRLLQFRPHRGREGYVIFPTVEREQARVLAAWQAAAADVAADFTRDGGGR